MKRDPWMVVGDSFCYGCAVVIVGGCGWGLKKLYDRLCQKEKEKSK